MRMAIKLPENANFEGLESWTPGGAKVEVGVHEAKIQEIELQKDQKGFPKLNIKYEVIAGECQGGVVYGSRSLSPGALNYFKGFCEMLNVSFKGSAFDEKGFIGRVLRIDVKPYTKQDGSMGTRVENLFPSEIGQNDPVDITVDPTTVDLSEEPDSSGKASDDDDNVPF
jgi:hypothetical protein